MKFEGEVVVDAPPRAVWRRLADFESAAELVPFLERVELVGELPPREGSEVLIVASLGGHRVATDATVSTFAPNEALVLEATLPEVRSTVSLGWALTPQGDGTRVHQVVEINFGSTMARLGAQAMLGNMLSNKTIEEALAALKDRIEIETRDSTDGEE
jgi:carbon monoxide dehydrogenase subunit G